MLVLLVDYCRMKAGPFLSYRIKKLRSFLILIVPKRLFSEHLHKMFGEISVRI
jgi:hypothetical protein